MKRLLATFLTGLLLVSMGCKRSERIESSATPASDTSPSASAPTGGPASLSQAAATATPTPVTPPAPSSAVTPPPVPAAPAANDEVAVITTTKGTMVAEFWPDVAPQTVDNFKKLARQSFYDGTIFHRIMKDFMIQGGDPLSKDPEKKELYGTGGPGFTIDAEFNDRRHELGVLSMARGRDPNSAGSQFFICLGRATTLDRNYTGFGKLIKGEDVLRTIGETPVAPDPNRPEEPAQVPTERVQITSVKIVKRSEIM